VFRHANLRSALGAMLGGKARDDAGLRANMSLHLPAPAKK